MNKLKSIWQIEDLRKKILFTLLLILVFRLGCSIPVPFVSNTALDSMFSNDSIFGYMNMLSGGALSRCAFFALGVSPYINSSIITQLLCVALPSWEALQKETTGKDKLDEYTKRIALAMAAIMSIGYYFVLRNYGALEYTAGKSGVFAAAVIMATFLAGSQLSVWIGGRMEEDRRVNALAVEMLRNPEITAYTDGYNICIGTNNSLVTSLDSRELRHYAIQGFRVHEVAHILFTDFPTLKNWVGHLNQGIWWPKIPDRASEKRWSGIDKTTEKAEILQTIRFYCT